MNIPNKKPVHHSKMRHEQAIRCAVNDILNGALYSNITQRLVEDEYNLDYNYSEREAQRIVREARKRMKEDYQEVVPHMRELLTSMCMDILTDARESGDNSNALKAIQEVAKLTGAYEPIKTENKVKVINIDFGLEDDESQD